MNLKEQIEDATQAVVDAFKPIDGRLTDADILDTLKKEHDEVKELLANLQDAETAAQRRGIVRKLTEALVPHSVAEEKIVYKAMVALPDQQAQVDGYEGTLEHKWAAKTLERLGAIADATSSEHKATAKVLKELVEHHIKEEERNIWRDVRKHCSQEERARMNALYLTEKHNTKVPTLPV
jgi:hemerythrin-like domain-containing protein